VVVARLRQVAVVVDHAVLEELLGAGVAAAVGHDAHVVVVDLAVAHGDAVGLVDAHARAVVGLVVGAEELESLE
jgi:hypothetical protein